MGRRDAVQAILEVVSFMRSLEPRLLVTYEPGWETRGNGSSPNYEFGTVHHTASLSSAAKPFPTQNLLRVGRSDLPGPLCNFAGPWCTEDAPRIHVVAAFPANHAGASRASGPVPALSLFNPRTLGLEIDYAGTVPMTGGQRRVALAWAKAVAHVVGGGDIERVRAHAETSKTGKYDPGFAPGKTYDMAAFRRDAAALTPQGADMPLSPADFAEIRKIVWQEILNVVRTDGVSDNSASAARQSGAAVKEIAALRGVIDGLIATLSKGTGASAVDVKTAVNEALTENLVRVEVSVTGTEA